MHAVRSDTLSMLGGLVLTHVMKSNEFCMLWGPVLDACYDV